MATMIGLTQEKEGAGAMPCPVRNKKYAYKHTYGDRKHNLTLKNNKNNKK